MLAATAMASTDVPITPAKTRSSRRGSRQRQSQPAAPCRSPERPCAFAGTTVAIGFDRRRVIERDDFDGVEFFARGGPCELAAGCSVGMILAENRYS